MPSFGFGTGLRAASRPALAAMMCSTFTAVQQDENRLTTLAITSVAQHKADVLALPEVPIARKIESAVGDTHLGLRLYQYQTCPFCCKVRTFLDYYGLDYEVVEVNPVTRKQIKFSKGYRKVPLLVAQDLDNFRLKDSSLVISIMQSFVMDPSLPLQSISDLYPEVTMPDPDDEKKTVAKVPNKYFFMVEENNEDVIATMQEERKWRMWVDEQLVHVLSPNVYRSWGEAFDAFTWFSKVGEWDRHFANWEVTMVVYVGAAMMYYIGKRLKKRHGLKPDVRESLYDCARTWLRALGKRKFMGGDKPNVADLNAYGVLLSIEGCQAFIDLLRETRIGPWFYRMKDAVTKREGAPALRKALEEAGGSVRRSSTPGPTIQAEPPSLM